MYRERYQKMSNEISTDRLPVISILYGFLTLCFLVAAISYKEPGQRIHSEPLFAVFLELLIISTSMALLSCLARKFPKLSTWTLVIELIIFLAVIEMSYWSNDFDAKGLTQLLTFNFQLDNVLWSTLVLILHLDFRLVLVHFILHLAAISRLVLQRTTVSEDDFLDMNYAINSIIGVVVYQSIFIFCLYFVERSRVKMFCL